MNSNKFNLCVLPTQMGKTFIIINYIKNNLLNDITEGRSLHIVFTMNTLLNNKQFSNRLECINNDYGTNSICVFSSIYKGPYGHANNFANLVKYTENHMPRIIIACSNKTRFSNCFNFITELAKKNSDETNVRRVFVYFDELHKYISNTKYDIRRNIENLNKLNIVSGIYGMTASPNNIWTSNMSGFWSNIKIIDIKDCYHDNNYFGVNDIEFICPCKNSDYNIIDGSIDSELFNEQECFTINFIIKTLKKYPDILNDNNRVFIPVKNRIKTHYYIREHLFKIRNNCLIITINGKEKNIIYKANDKSKDKSNDKSKDKSNDKSNEEDEEYVSIPLILNKGELGDLIVENISKYNLHNRPIIFIGYNCVGMGQTLITEKLGNFTSAIFGYDVILNDNMYQLFGRITGRFKNWRKYNVTKVYCTLLCKHISNIMENCAKNIAINHNNKLLNNTKYLEPFNNTNNIDSFSKEELNILKKNFKLKDIEYNIWHEPLTSIQEVEKVLTQIFKSNITIKEFINIEGYLLSKNIKKYYKKSNNQLIAIDRLTIDKYTDITMSLKQFISNENKTYKYIVLPVYASLDTTCVEYKLHYSS